MRYSEGNYRSGASTHFRNSITMLARQCDGGDCHHECCLYTIIDNDEDDDEVQVTTKTFCGVVGVFVF